MGTIEIHLDDNDHRLLAKAKRGDPMTPEESRQLTGLGIIQALNGMFVETDRQRHVDVYDLSNRLMT